MKDEVIKCLNDIAKAIDAIDRFIGEKKSLQVSKIMKC